MILYTGAFTIGKKGRRIHRPAPLAMHFYVCLQVSYQACLAFFRRFENSRAFPMSPSTLIFLSV